MRPGLHDGELIFGDSGEFIGVCLGWDYTAEHEWGIDDLKRSAKCDSKKFGFESTKFKDSSFIITQKDKSRALVATCGADFERVMREGKEFSTEMGIKFYGSWSSSDFGIAFTEIPNDESHKVVDEFISAIKNKDICFSFNKNENPFARSGLTLLIYSRIPKSIKKMCMDADINNNKMMDAFYANPTIKEFERNRKEWCDSHAGRRSPWDYIYMKPRSWDGKNNFEIWLNPNNQQHIECGWVTISDIKDWINGKPGKIIKSNTHWDELKFICSGDRNWSISYDLRHFTGVKPKYFSRQVWGSSYEDVKKPCLPPLGKNGVVPKKAINIIASIIKDMYIRDIKDQVEFGHCDNDKITDIYHVSRASSRIDDIVYGLLYGFALMGYGSFGACNTPKDPTNFSWFKDLLFIESLWDVMVEQGKGYQPWIDAGESLEYKKEK